MSSLVHLMLTVLLNASWQVAIVTLFAGCGSWVLRGTAARYRHSVWVVAMVTSLCLPIITSLNILKPSIVPKQNVALSESETTLTPPVGLQALKLTELTITAIEIPVVQPTQQNDWSSRIRVNRNLAVVLVAFYTLFLSYRGFKLIRAWRRTAALMSGAFHAKISGRARAIIAKCQTTMGVEHINVVCSASVHLPITAGVFNPLVILPEQLLTEADEDMLLSAIGHELAHVVRRDYVLNLVYELIYLPLCFHPAAALLRRRIKQTRELCCDELVARKLLAPEVYARSLVRLIGSVPLAGRLAADTTIGITDADILEVRIMSLLKTSKLSARRNTLLLFAAFLLLSAPCAAAAAFALQFDIDKPEAAISQKDEQDKETAQKLERAREELQRKERELVERMVKNPNPQGEEFEKLRRMEIELKEASARLAQDQETLHLKETEQGVRQLHERLAQIKATQPADEARMREVKEQLAQLQRSLPENQERSRELRDQLAMVERQFPNSRQMTEKLESLGRAREELDKQRELWAIRAKEYGISAKEYGISAKEYGISAKEYEEQSRKGIDKHRKELDEAGRAVLRMTTTQKNALSHRKELDEVVGSVFAVGSVFVNEQSELTQGATISMDRAIQIAVSQYPGKVLACSLGRQTDGQAFYRLVIVIKERDKSSAKRVWVSATDGRILKTHDE